MILRGGAALLNLCKTALFPQFCHYCNAPLLKLTELVFCNDCLGKIEKKEFINSCSVCSAEIAGGKICGSCLITPPSYKFHKSVTLYEKEVRQLILLFKYGGKEVLADKMASLYKETAEDLVRIFKPDFITIVPDDRRRKYGFNHNRVVASALACTLGLRLEAGVLKKIRSTPPQASLRVNERLKNLDNTFVVRKSHRKYLKNSVVLLLDDVFTTGTTMDKCSRTLADAGAEVIGITLARSVVD